MARNSTSIITNFCKKIIALILCCCMLPSFTACQMKEQIKPFDFDIGDDEMNQNNPLLTGVYNPDNTPELPEEMETVIYEQVDALSFVSPSNNDDQANIYYTDLEKIHPGIFTKLFFAYMVLEKLNPSDFVQIVNYPIGENTKTSLTFFPVNTYITVETALTLMLLDEYEDIPVSLAASISGSEYNFLEYMNLYINEVLGIKNTKFEDLTGEAESSYTTITDLSKMISLVFSTDSIKKILAINEFTPTYYTSIDVETIETSQVVTNVVITNKLPHVTGDLLLNTLSSVYTYCDVTKESISDIIVYGANEINQQYIAILIGMTSFEEGFALLEELFINTP